jgi:hypothetical protein
MSPPEGGRDAANHRILHSIVTRASVELFSAYKVHLTRRKELAPTEETTFAATIGFTGASMRGALLLAPTETALARTYPSGKQPHDWASELANQLLGRIKNRLVSYGVEICPSVPVAIKGRGLSIVARGDIPPYLFDAQPGLVTVLFDVEMHHELILAPQDVTPCPTEGDTLLF